MDFRETKLKPNPIEKANPISRIFFLWMIPLFRKGRKKDLTLEDLWNHREADHARTLGDRLEDLWTLESKKAKEKGRKPSLYKPLFRLIAGRLAFCTLFYMFQFWVITIAQPLLLRRLINSFNAGDQDSWETWVTAGAICICVFLNAVILHPNIFEIFRLGMRGRVATSALIYRKALRLSSASQGEATVGRMVNLLSNDVNRFDTSLNFLPFMITAPVQTLIFTYLLWDAIGPSCFVGLGVILLLSPFQFWNGKYSAKFRLNIAKWTDERGRIMNEIIIGMRVIKMYAWEKPFSLLIDRIRKSEVTELRKRALLRGINLAFIQASPKFIAFCTFLVYVLLGNDMSSETVFFTLTILNMVCQQTLHFLPQAIAGLGELVVAIRRIEAFLLLKEQEVGSVSRPLPVDDPQPEIKLEKFTASWTQDRSTLEEITSHVKGNKLVMVVGHVGSGKTSLLHTLIGELPASSGAVHVSGSTSYASQEPWIFAGNLRQNILFGQPFDNDRYWETIKYCALEQDLVQLPYSDMTVVGERGVALSGGQKARVNLARALYRKADIYLMDDPLSAVDTKVSRQLFEQCIRGPFLTGSLRVLATHQLQYLPRADHIIVLKQGRVMAQGTYEQLVEDGIDFVSLMTSDASTDPASRKGSLLQPEHQPEPSPDTDADKPEEHNEKASVGSVTAKTYLEYFQSAKSPLQFILLTISFLLCQILLSGNDYWLSFWANAEDAKQEYQNSNATDCVLPNGCQPDSYLGRDVYLYTYTGFNAAAVLMSVIRSMWFFYFCCEISVNLHNWMFESMVRAPTKFFDDNPSGRIMNRFTKDIGAVDELLPPAFADTLAILLSMIGVVAVVIMANYYMAVPTVFLLVGLYALRNFFVQTGRDLKRIEALTRSPLFTHVAATMQGITTIRAAGTQDILLQQFDGHQNVHSSVWYLFLAANRWFGIWLEILSTLFLTVVALSFMLIASSDAGGNIGLAISSCLTLMGTFQWGMRQSAETENYMTSVERSMEYAKLEPEAPLETVDKKQKPPPSWPSGGSIRFQNVFLSYDEKPVLKNLSFEIASRSKVGIVGRTGAGKSSMITALFRMTEPEGQIFIDGVNIGEIGLHDLRKNISIIPQDPVLFSGTVRYNLDPFDQFEDREIWSALEEVELKEAVPSLDFKVTDAGGNFSVGQRQLVCLARAILRKNKIIVMDEATANVDPKTDSLIQRTIRYKFADCTILTIAHRLHSVIDCDKILVLDHGDLAEFGHPHTLLQRSDGILTSMVEQTGKGSASKLKRSAEESYNKMKGENDSNNSQLIVNKDSTTTL